MARIAMRLFFSIQAAVLLYHYAWYVSAFPPDAYDQALYLESTYSLVSKGMGSIFANIISAGPQSALFASEGALIQEVFRLPRFSELLLNYFALAAAEVCIYRTVRHVSRSCFLSLASVGLFISAHTPWFWAGGLYDFRIDWLASCLYGMWCCAVLRSGIFESRKWTLISVAMSCFLILNRYVTGAYVLGVEFVLLALFGSYEAYNRRVWRSFNIGASVLLQVCVVSPFIYFNWQAIKGYYIVGHLTGNEKAVRAKEFGVESLFQNLIYYPLSVARDHLGSLFVLVVIAFALASGCLFIVARQSNPLNYRRHFNLQAVFLIGASTAPLAILTTDLSKSPVVGGIVDIPLVLLITLLPFWWRTFSDQALVRCRPYALGLSQTLGALLIVIGLGIEAYYSKFSVTDGQRTNYQTWALNVGLVVEDMMQNGDHTASMTANNLTPHLVPAVFRDVAYEMGHGDIDFTWSYQLAIFPPTLDAYMKGLKKSDYVFLSTSAMPAAYPVSAFFDENNKYITEWVRSNMDTMLEFKYDGGTVQTFKRRPDLVQVWSASAYELERYESRGFRWFKSIVDLKISKPNFPCLIIPMFSAYSQQRVHISSDLGESRDVDLSKTDIQHPVNVVLPLPSRDQTVTFKFQASDPPTVFPNDGREAAFGAYEGHAGVCPD